MYNDINFFDSSSDNDIYGRPVILELPDEGTPTTFFYPTECLQENELSQVVDWDAVDNYLPTTLSDVVPSHVFPIKVGGDGNCLLRAVSFALWGVEDYYYCLRNLLCEELRSNFEWYIEKTQETSTKAKEWKDHLQIADTPNAYLSCAHIFALSNAIERVIVLYASDEQVKTFGGTEDGVAGTFIPSRIDKKKWINRPIIPITWSNNTNNHFIPLIGVENLHFEWPIMPIGFKQENIITDDEFIQLFKCGNRIEPQQVLKLRNKTAKINHFALLDTPQQNKYKFLQIDGEMVAIRENNVENDDKPLFANLHLNGKYLRLQITQLSVYDVEVYLNQRNISLAHRDRLVKYIYNRGQIEKKRLQEKVLGTNISLVEEQDDDSDEESTNNVDDLVPLGRDYYTQFPSKKYRIYYDCKNLSKIINKIIKDFKLQSKEQKTLENMQSIIIKYSNYLKNQTKEDFNTNITQDMFDFIIKYLKVDSKDVFPIFDLARFFIVIPQAKDYFAIHMNDIDDPYNILSLVLPQIQYITKTTFKPIIGTFTQLILNMFNCPVFIPHLLDHCNSFLKIIDKCITSFAEIPLYKTYGEILKCISQAIISQTSLDNENIIPHSLKLQIIFCCIKILGIYHLSKATDKTLPLYINLNYDVVLTIANLLYSDNILQKKILKTNLRWPIININNSVDKDSLLYTLTTELLEMLAKPSCTSRKIQELSDRLR